MEINNNDQPLYFDGASVYLRVEDDDKQNALDVFNQIEEAISNPVTDDDFTSGRESHSEPDNTGGFLFSEEQRDQLDEFFPEEALFDVEMKEPEWQNDEHGKIWVTAFNEEFPGKLRKIMNEQETFYEVVYERSTRSNKEESTTEFDDALELLKNWHSGGTGNSEEPQVKSEEKPSFLD